VASPTKSQAVYRSLAVTRRGQTQAVYGSCPSLFAQPGCPSIREGVNLHGLNASPV
jgi:hypothetical protein